MSSFSSERESTGLGFGLFRYPNEVLAVTRQLSSQRKDEDSGQALEGDPADRGGGRLGGSMH